MLAALGAAIVILVVVAAAVISQGGDDPPTRVAGTEVSAPSRAGKGSTTTTTTSTVPVSTKPTWPPTALGRPAALGPSGTAPEAVPADAPPGVYVWSDFDGWHLWMVNGEGVTGVQGAVVSDDEIVKADLAAAGVGERTITNNVIQFDLPADVRVSGLDINPGFYAKQLRFRFEGPDGEYPAATIKTGGLATPVTALPLILEKAQA